MQRFILRSALLLVITVLTTAGVQAQKAPRFRALVLTERGGFHEPYVVAGLAWLTQLAADSNFVFDVYNNTDSINDAFLARYQVFVQLNYPPYMWTSTAMAAFVKFIEQGKGGGWVGFHHASLLGEFDGYPLWPWFSQFMGGIRFKNYIAALVAGDVNVEDKKHPCMKGLPSTFRIDHEEWYTYDKNPRPGVHVLASVNEASYSPPSDIKMGDHPVIWTNVKMKARNIYIQMGHHPDHFKNESYEKLVRNAIFWAAGCDTYNKRER